MGPLLGIDLGGTKIEAVIIDDRDDLNVLKRMRVPTEAHKGYEHIIQQIAKLVEVMTTETGVKPTKIGLGSPGVLDPSTQTIKNSNTVCLNGKAMKQDLEAALDIPILIANDANCFAIAEATMGAVKDHIKNPEVVFGVIMGTGVGGGVVVNGKVLMGHHGIGGEWGHSFLDDSGGQCYCGKLGCVEKLISGRALENYYESIMGVPRDLAEIVSRHEAGDDMVATKTINRLIRYFGKGLANVINIIDPDAIVIGGGLGNIDLLYTEGVKEVEKHIFNDRLDTLFLKPKLGDSAGVFGAALL